jgi:hypothetical protein
VALVRREERKPTGWWLAIAAGVAVVVVAETVRIAWPSGSAKVTASPAADAARAEPDSAAAVSSGAAAPEAEGAWRTLPSATVTSAASRRPRPLLDLSGAEMHDYLQRQAHLLRREPPENAGTASALTPSAEEIEKMVREERVVF